MNMLMYITQVRLLGVIGLIDGGETDWKLLAIDINDREAYTLNGLIDIEQNMPGLLNATVNWFRRYKIPEGKPENEFAFGGEPKDASFARQIVKETHEHWKHLMEGVETVHGIDRSCSKCGYQSKIRSEDAKCMVENMAPKTDIRDDVTPSAATQLYHYCT